jgi:hypothetical protein
MGFTPRAALDEDAADPGFSRGQHIIIKPVSDVRDLLRRHSCRLDQALEECFRRLAHAPTVGASDNVDRQVGVKDRLIEDVRGEIAGNANESTLRLHIRQAGSGIGVKVSLQKPLHPSGISSRFQLGLKVEAKTSEELAMVSSLGNHLVQRRKELALTNAQPLGPLTPQSCLVEERVANVEKYRANAHGQPRDLERSPVIVENRAILQTIGI